MLTCINLTSAEKDKLCDPDNFEKAMRKQQNSSLKRHNTTQTIGSDDENQLTTVIGNEHDDNGFQNVSRGGHHYRHKPKQMRINNERNMCSDVTLWNDVPRSTMACISNNSGNRTQGEEQTKNAYDRRDNQQKTMDKNNEERTRINISQHALSYAVEQQLPYFKIECEPPVNDQVQGTSLVKSLFSSIETKFRQLNRSISHPLGFEYWYIDKHGHLICYTREPELFVYLCDAGNYPNKLLNINITPVLPKRLPPQYSVILKFVPNDISLDDVKCEVTSRCSSLFGAEDMRGTNTGKSRHIRLDITDRQQYEKVLNSGILPFQGRLYEVVEFLAPPRLLVCSKCNYPGHIKKECSARYELCRRCGGDRTSGEHKECPICCHHCGGDHISTDYKCPLIANYRRELVLTLKKRPDLLPPDVQLFVPSECREKGDKKGNVLYNHVAAAHHQMRRQQQQQSYVNNSNEWLPLPRPIAFTHASSSAGSVSNENNIWNEMKKAQLEYSQLKAVMEQRDQEIKLKYDQQLVRLHAVMQHINMQVSAQNDVLKCSISVIGEVLPMMAMVLTVVKQVIVKTNAMTVDVQEKKNNEEMTSLLSTHIDHLQDRHNMISDLQKQHGAILEKQQQLAFEAVSICLNNNG